MKLMMCMRGEAEQLPYLQEIAELGAGIELGSYGMIGVRSEREWESRLALHQVIRKQFEGVIALHGPFFGMEYNHIDHLIRDVVNRRMDMTLDAAMKLKAIRVVLHSGYKPEIELFKLQDTWLKGCVEFWQREILRWEAAGIQIVLENDTEKSPDLLVQLVNEVNSPYLGLCMDIGHQHLLSELNALEWVRRMQEWLFHIHLHDNDHTNDSHWPIGRGTVDFEPFYEDIKERSPKATLSLEVEDEMEVKMGNLRSLAKYFS